MDSAAEAATPEAARQQDAPIAYRDVTLESGVDFEHWDGRSGRRYYPETASGGGGLFDADGDGDLDLYLINGATTPGSPPGRQPRNALYLQQSSGPGGTGAPRFVKASAAGVDDPGFGMGLCAADLNGDGLADFLLTNFGPDRLFVSRAAASGPPDWTSVPMPGERWGTGCAFGDLDGDGDLDLYVANYLAVDFDRHPTCGDPARGLASYCRPSAFAGQADQLYMNRGVGADGVPRFEEAGAVRGVIQGSDEKGFGVLMSDFDDDGDLDILVANDGTPNRLYANDGRGFLEDAGLSSGLALSGDGIPQASMGLDVGDADGDGRLDVMMTHYAFESNTLYLNAGRGPGRALYDDRTADSGLHAPSYLSVGWGVRFFDADNDGDLDLAVANGHVLDNAELFDVRTSYAQPDHLYTNDGAGSFTEASAGVPGFAAPEPTVSRALATGDLDDDGRLDLLITTTNGRPRLLRGVGSAPGRWLGVRLLGPVSNTFAIGARA
ncbi:MAG: VCBS repeat-containing protein, partial [Acidobacteriota bacterium]